VIIAEDVDVEDVDVGDVGRPGECKELRAARRLVVGVVDKSVAVGVDAAPKHAPAEAAGPR
jgi:hypothetical protein